MSPRPSLVDGKPLDPSIMRARETALRADSLREALARLPLHEILCPVLAELVSLERYERNALSRRRRAIRRFDALRSKKHLSVA
jgi:hypothetical protein